MMHQYSLRFPDQPEQFEDLAITDSNRAAIEAIRNVAGWVGPALCLIGPVQSGLRVTARLWAEENKAQLLSARGFDALSEADLAELVSGPLAIDLADQIEIEANLLTVLNLSAQRDTRLLLTARKSAALWRCQSADLRSRLSALPSAEIYPPDDEMLVERLQAACRRRYMRLSEQTIAFLVIRLPRSYAAIEDYVSRLDKAVDENQRAPSIHLARSVLEDGAGPGALFDEADDPSG